MPGNKSPDSLDNVRKLVAEQCPQWAGEPVGKLTEAGTDHSLYRLGTDKLIRIPVATSAFGQPEKESSLLPLLRNLPLQIPKPLYLGRQGAFYWLVVSWIAGEPAADESISDWRLAGKQITNFLQGLWRIDPGKGLPAGAHNGHRGGKLQRRDAAVQDAFARLHDEIDVASLAPLWTAALKANQNARDFWVHGDLHSGNLIADKGLLVGVIDWGLMGVGDPAVDLMVAWTWLPLSVRAQFKTDLGCDDDTWERARGWATSFAVIALAHYRGTQLPIENIARSTIRAVLETC